MSYLLEAAGVQPIVLPEMGRDVAPLADTATLEPTDARTFRRVLRQPFPLLLEVLGKPNAPQGTDEDIGHRGEP